MWAFVLHPHTAGVLPHAIDKAVVAVQRPSRLCPPRKCAAVLIHLIRWLWLLTDGAERRATVTRQTLQVYHCLPRITQAVQYFGLATASSPPEDCNEGIFLVLAFLHSGLLLALRKSAL
eukprot:COSAG02_NODE_1833_length_10721_cov_4.893523_8_plen_119_part_00